MVKRSTVTGLYDRVHKTTVMACWAAAITTGVVVAFKSFEILFIPQKTISVEDLPEYQRIMMLKKKENEELLKE